MKIQDFLDHHGIEGNPFAEEDAQNDTVFKRVCLESTFHPAWDKVYGNPDDPSTAIVFGEKGSGKTALKLQMVRQFEKHGEEHPGRKTFVVLYDDFNPFLDRFLDRVGPRRPVERTLAQWRLWDHIDAILAIGTTQLVTALIDGGGRDRPRLSPPQARDLALLAACYDQSTGETFPSRWARLRRLSGYSLLRTAWKPALGVAAVALVLLALAGSARSGTGWSGIVPPGAPWWVPLAFVAAAWVPWLVGRARGWWTARQVVRSMRTGNRTVGQLAQALSRMPAADLAGQPLPRHARSDDRYELLAKFQGVLGALGHSGMVVIIDRVDEPHAINGQAERMRLLVWPLLDNKFLKSPGLGFKLLLPDELYRFIEREDEQFNQRARLDKQNLVPGLEWTGETLYDIASQRVQAAGRRSPPATLAELFDPALDRRRLIDGLRTLRVPRNLFKFLHRLLVAHCHSHTAEQPVWTIPVELFERELAVFRRDQDAFDRGLAPR
ncbi:MAG: hypothetical protein ACKO3G_01615 [Planctomycetaceae bacterium]